MNFYWLFAVAKQRRDSAHRHTRLMTRRHKTGRIDTPLRPANSSTVINV